jgi:hypothetical protein
MGSTTKNHILDVHLKKLCRSELLKRKMPTITMEEAMPLIMLKHRKNCKDSATQFIPKPLQMLLPQIQQGTMS